MVVIGWYGAALIPARNRCLAIILSSVERRRRPSGVYTATEINWNVLNWNLGSVRLSKAHDMNWTYYIIFWQNVIAAET